MNERETESRQQHNIVERVAREIGESLYGYCTPEDTPNIWATAESLARAAIAAMEPTKEMVAAGNRLIRDLRRDELEPDAEDVFDVMID